MTHSDDIPGSGNKGEKTIELHTRDEVQAQEGTEERAANSVRDSGQIYDISRIKKAVENAPDMRAEKVALLKKMISSGEYNVDSREVADKMIKEFLLDDSLKR